MAPMADAILKFKKIEPVAGKDYKGIALTTGVIAATLLGWFVVLTIATGV